MVSISVSQLVGCSLPPVLHTSVTQASASLKSLEQLLDPAESEHHQGPVAPMQMETRPLGIPVNAPILRRRTQDIPTNSQDPTAPPTRLLPHVTVDAKVLVMVADRSEPAAAAITKALDFLGTPYTVYVPSQHPEGLSPAMLFDGTHAHYQGVILSNGSLSYFNGSAWRSALSQKEWQTLWQFETSFGVRQAAWYIYPGTDNGLKGPAGVSTLTTPIAATLTQAGSDVFPYVNAERPLEIKNAYAYLATAIDASTIPLLMDSSGHALAGVHTTADGRQTLFMTFDSNPYLLHSLALSFGVINWVTRGAFLGERNSYLSAQVDDVFLPDAMWQAPNFRMTASDLQALAAWQTQRQAQPTTRDFKVDLAFNGFGAEGTYDPDTLTPAAAQLQGQFKWISHTYNHQTMDDLSYDEGFKEQSENDRVAKKLGLSSYQPANLVTPNVSGLKNPKVMKALYDDGVRFVVSDTSVKGYDNPSPNAGLPNPFVPQILMIPRHPTNLYYNVSTPAEWTSEYNALYHRFWGRDLSYPEILDKESDLMLQYLLRGDMDPLMFHQPNLRAYDGTHSLLGDLIDRASDKYNALFNVPILSPTMDDLGKQMLNRMAFDKASVTGTITDWETISVTAQRAVTVPISGIRTNDQGDVASQTIARVTLSPGQTVTVGLPSDPGPGDVVGIDTTDN